MSDTVIRVENLSKKYVLNHQQEGRKYKTLRDVMVGSIKSVGKRFSIKNKIENPSKEEFWALKDVSFEIQQGDRIGIIGRNGAGKSTLLKVLSRITDPTQGRIKIKGRVASLLEVGTGFHPELTGRENIYLNGAILGMSREEIKRKFDEIVTFAEVEKFLDTPVKRYSSGMYVRLAFAVAANLEPEILIVDEVLAVGDAQFQKKCLQKMKDVNDDGRTVLLVSHQMTTIKALATKAIFLERGYTEGISDVNCAVEKYLFSSSNHQGGTFITHQPRSHKDAYITEVNLFNGLNEIQTNFLTYEAIFIEIVWVNCAGVAVMPNFMLVNSQGITVMIASDAPSDFDGSQKKRPGRYISRFKIPANLLNSNHYVLHVALDCGSPRICYDYHLNVIHFSVTDPMDEHCIARGAMTSVREDAALWPALECSWKRIDELATL
ncbi:ABC transporter ATP-binding protein [Pantanalinema rosaneae CENA516]|uniref:ABC transporter ATP-binding protein n=1 Tax=Pantanalinema rosaneae TaxID=1620701 RepID=UPI003D6FEFA2